VFSLATGGLLLAKPRKSCQVHFFNIETNVLTKKSKHYIDRILESERQRGKRALSKICCANSVRDRCVAC